MAARKPAPPPPPARSAPRQTFGDRMAANMAAAKNQADGQRAAKQAEQMSQSRQAAERMSKFGGADGRFGQGSSPMPTPPQQASQNMAPGTGGRGTQQYEARRQQQAMPSGQGLGRGMAPPNQMLQSSGPTPPPMQQYGAQTQMPPGGGLPNAALGGMAPMGPGTQTGGPAPMGMGPTGPGGMAAMGAFKKGGAVKAKAFAKGGSVKATSMGTVKTAKPTMRSASSRGDGIAIRGKTRA